MQTVLFISDNQDHLATVRAALREDGHALRAEPTIERALLAVREQQPDLLCLDLSSGAAMNGLAALLRAQQQQGSVPVLAITTREQFYLVGPGSGVADVIVTPLDRDELQLRVARLVTAARRIGQPAAAPRRAADRPGALHRAPSATRPWT